MSESTIYLDSVFPEYKKISEAPTMAALQTLSEYQDESGQTQIDYEKLEKLIRAELPNRYKAAMPIRGGGFDIYLCESPLNYAWQAATGARVITRARPVKLSSDKSRREALF